ncbi:hypothetical protein OIDMADRAFT_48807 [Oidiodendron maius Zn]|uniref:Uncharacterized protein n=1 Tax=Oidiodendron maius (strain Zn) TaxID=913774 RepID=A0A0C3HL59_OIDMZ|nr:hypothetical protein OIDMADRAFT_48807 [Oidiodendron maius Zn]
MTEYSTNDGGCCGELCIGCSTHHWAVAARAVLCVVTVGLSEAMRGRAGWCGALFGPTTYQAKTPMYDREMSPMQQRHPSNQYAQPTGMNSAPLSRKPVRQSLDSNGNIVGQNMDEPVNQQIPVFQPQPVYEPQGIH